MNYQITDNQTGQKFQVNWQGDKPPTDAEMGEIQSKVAASSTAPVVKPTTHGNYLTDTVLPDAVANLQAVNPIELLKKGYAYGQKLTDVGNTAENNADKTAPALFWDVNGTTSLRKFYNLFFENHHGKPPV